MYKKKAFYILSFIIIALIFAILSGKYLKTKKITSIKIIEGAGISETAIIEKQEDIEDFLSLIDFKNLDKADKAKYDLKCSPAFTVFFNSDETILEIMPYELGDKYTYYYLDRKCYFLEGGDMYNKVADFYNKFK